MPNRSLEQSQALRALKQRLQAEQLGFDPDDAQYTAYQTQIDAAQAKEDSLRDARLQARQSRSQQRLQR